MSLVQLPITFDDVTTALDRHDAKAYAWARNSDPNWSAAIVAELRPTLKAIYGKTIRKRDVESSSFAVVIKKCGERGGVIACALLSFSSYPDNCFNIYCEGVHPDFRNRGVGTALYKAIEHATDFFACMDPYTVLSLSGEEEYTLRVGLDKDKPNTEALTRFL